MEIPLDVQVECSDGDNRHPIGHSVFVLINPITDQVAHLVVEAENSPNTEYIVPIDMVAETSAETVRLKCTVAELEKMPVFIKNEFIKDKVLNYAGYGGGITRKDSCYYMPYVTSEVRVPVYAVRQQIPPGELAVHRGTHVEATDGHVGKVDEFVVNPENSHITHLVMREGHLWGKKDVIIPISAIGETRENTLFLNLNKQQVESLPAFPLHRHAAF
jgi:sporulation protein YlmC with PRC-barrel domain